jgi:UDP-glucose 4-epimerase
MEIKGSNILVTGGAGFIGSHVVEKLLTFAPSNIIILDNMLRGSHENMASFSDNPSVEFIQGDIRNEAILNKIMPRVDYVFHMAALRITRCAEDPLEAFAVMVEATTRIVHLSKIYNIKKIIYSSSASIYGMAREFPTSESTDPYNNDTLYGAAKLYGEQLLRSYTSMYNLNYVALRYFNVYGPRMDTEGKYTEVMIRWLDCIRERQNPLIFGDGSTSMYFIYVEDVANANVQALLSDVSDEAINVGFSRETSLKELLNIMLRVNNSKLSPEYKDERSINSVRRRIADISKAKKLIAWEPDITLEEGLKLLSKWYYDKA